MLRLLSLSLLAALLLTACTASDAPDDGRLDVVATTSYVADLARQIGGDAVRVEGLMGAGIDPHTYQASEGDVTRMAQADLVLYHGLHLEGRMVDVFEQMQSRGRATAALAERGVPEAALIASEDYASSADPHVWFDVRLWRGVAEEVAEALSDADPENAETFAQNLAEYQSELDSLHAWVQSRIAEVPEERRVLITSHDAFGYFGRAYGFDVRGLQGLSTATEAGTADVQQLADFVAERDIPAMFVESSVSSRGIEAVREAVRSRGASVEIGGSLFSDALGDEGSPEGTYVGTVRHNVNTIVDALAPRRSSGEAGV
jgi:manganese/zinc/iron transport system substrate-binding protein